MKYKMGKAQKLWKCCREIRLTVPKEVGGISQGYNTLTDEIETWMLIKKHKTDHNNHIMQRIFKPIESSEVKLNTEIKKSLKRAV